MKRISWLITGIGALGLTLAALGQDATSPVADRYIVTLKSGDDPGVVAVGHGLAPNHVYTKVLRGFAAKIPPGRLKALADDPRIAAITPDNVVTILGKPTGGGGGTTTTQTVPKGVKRIAAASAWASGITGTNIGVAVVDTGLDFNHADLKPLGGYSFSAFGGSAQDDNGHGTHVGGIIAARNNKQDVVGVAPGATLYAVKVLDSTGSGTDSDVIGGLEWVVANAGTIRVVNMSLGRPASSDDSAIHTAVRTVVAADITVVVAAGNSRTNEVSDMVPAGFAEVIAVASSTAVQGTASRIYGYIPADAASYFTTDGALDPITGIGVTISAPGEDQENVSNSGLITSAGILSTKLGGGTTRMSGTSMASPHVAGVVALLCQKYPTLSPDQAKTKVAAGDHVGAAPLDSKTSKGYFISGYTFDGVREGIVYAPNALAAP